jgi:transposase
MLPRERAELLLAEHAAGTPIRVIAKTLGHSAGTVRDYVHGRKIRGSQPSEPTSSKDSRPTAGGAWPMTRTCGPPPC